METTLATALHHVMQLLRRMELKPETEEEAAPGNKVSNCEVDVSRRRFFSNQLVQNHHHSECNYLLVSATVLSNAP